ncbi:phosphatase PAP2 family protein [Neptunomonas antarctica]|uniref:Lipid A 4'-phosphatase n=1 Tax=Neptunomonas antarctica TaxID=619304 RepID=A0A1N7K8S0_9GAMM|nr:phosphatase PAP2 family protein [Neptunomonas antarctica]SIS57963.1 lipid A 4'-phosphatase [Neptunomonas antarctica]
MNSIKNLLLRKDIQIFLLCYIIFTLFSGVDLAVTSFFYNPADGFYLKDIWFNQFIHSTFARIHLLWLVLFIISLIYCWKNKLKAKQKVFLFLIVTMVVGPGLLVNVFIKDNSIGRARPVQIEQFGGTDTFTPAFIYSGQCQKNCSFVSGHAAIGFYAIVLGWIFRKRIWFWSGFSLGAIIGLSRMMEGGHFLSDIVFAFWSVYFSTLLLGHLFGYKAPTISPFQKEDT